MNRLDIRGQYYHVHLNIEMQKFFPCTIRIFIHFFLLIYCIGYKFFCLKFIGSFRWNYILVIDTQFFCWSIMRKLFFANRISAR